MSHSALFKNQHGLSDEVGFDWASFCLPSIRHEVRMTAFPGQLLLSLWFFVSLKIMGLDKMKIFRLYNSSQQ